MKSVRISPSKQKISFPSDVETYGQRLMEGASPESIPPNYYQQVSAYLQQYKQKFITSHDYITAQQIEDICGRLNEITTENVFGDFRQNQIQTLQLRLESAKSEYMKAKQKRVATQEKYEAERNESIEKLFQEQDDELDKFDVEIIQKVPPKYKKFSSEYLQLRRQEEFMVQSKRYAEANQFKIEADRLEEFERQNNDKKWANKVNQMRDSLIAKQRQQKAVLEDKWEMKWAEVMPKIMDFEQRCLKTVKAIEAKMLETPPTTVTSTASSSTTVNASASSTSTSTLATTKKTSSVSNQMTAESNDNESGRQMRKKKNSSCSSCGQKSGKKETTREKLPPLKVGAKQSATSRMRTLNYVNQTFHRNQIITHGSF